MDDKRYDDQGNAVHYRTESGEDTIDHIAALLHNKVELRGALKFTIMKYLARLGKKDAPILELTKADWYLRQLRDTYDQK